MKKSDEERIEEKILPLILKLKELHNQVDFMVKSGIITQEQADDMTGATIDKLDCEKKMKKKKRR